VVILKSAKNANSVILTIWVSLAMFLYFALLPLCQFESAQPLSGYFTVFAVASPSHWDHNTGYSLNIRTQYQATQLNIQFEVHMKAYWWYINLCSDECPAQIGREKYPMF
jgi:hypothetical protein